MANPYLIQAIYGPKPPVPRLDSTGTSNKPPDSRPVTPKVDVEDSGYNNESVSPQRLSPGANHFESAGNSNLSATRPLSSAERLYGSTVESKPGSNGDIHPDRLERNAASGNSELYS